MIEEAGKLSSTTRPVILWSDQLISPGRDASEAFEDVGHSDEARDMLPKMYLGDFHGEVGLSLPVHLD